MNVRTLCLSILYENDATGYEIRRLSTDGECSFFVEASFGSIYPALAKLEADKLVTGHVEQQNGKPAKKIYSITEAGRAAFVESLFEPLGEEIFRSPFLLFARFAHLVPAELVEARLNEQLDRLVAKRKMLEEVEQERVGPTDTWLINFGKACMEAGERHLRDHMDELVALARPAAPQKAAAE